jgi:hypothetical protein
LPLLFNEWQWSLRFHDDIRANTEAIAHACSWRLKAEEVRTQAEAFSSAEARNTMKTVAETWDHLAEDLERRLARKRASVATSSG